VSDVSDIRSAFSDVLGDFGGTATVFTYAATYNARGDESVTWSSSTDATVIISRGALKMGNHEFGRPDEGALAFFCEYDLSVGNGDKLAYNGDSYYVSEVKEYDLADSVLLKKINVKL